MLRTRAAHSAPQAIWTACATRMHTAAPSSATPRPLRIAIAGTGIAGPTLALALRARLAPSTPLHLHLFEQTPHFTPLVGAGIGIWGNSTRILTQLGIHLSDMEPHAHGRWMNAAAYRDAHTGNILAAAPTDWNLTHNNHAEPIHRCRVFSLRRSTLQTKLIEQIHKTQAAHIQYGCPIHTFHHDTQGKIKLVSQNDTILPHVYDLLIGCDGIHSRVAQQWQTDRTTSLGYHVLQGVATWPQNKTHPFPAYEAWGDGYRAACVPMAGRDVFFYASCDETESTQDALQRLVQWAQNGAPELVTTIQLISMDKIIRTPIRQTKPNLGWHDGKRTVLLGDAAHAMAPNMAQGAGLAIEGAAELANQLAEFVEDYQQDPHTLPTNAFDAYVAARIHRVQTVRFMTNAIAHIGGTQNPHMQRIRNAAMNLAPQTWIRGPLFAAALRIGLGWNYTPPILVPQPLYQRVLARNQSWEKLSKNLQRVHGQHGDVAFWTTDTLTVESGLPDWLRRFLGFPGTDATCLRARIRPRHSLAEAPEEWTRRFKTDSGKTYFFHSHQWIDRHDGRLYEAPVRFPYLQFGFALIPLDESSGFRHELQTCRFLCKIPVPKILSPSIDATTMDRPNVDRGWTFDVHMRLPPLLGGGTLVRYRGSARVMDEEPLLPSSSESTTPAIMILGATGTFGTLVVRLLRRDLARARLVLVTRRAHACRAFIREHGLPDNTRVCTLDAHEPGALARALERERPLVLVHTAGPFDDMSYFVARTCIAAGVHYVDLADDATFVRGVDDLDTEARAAGVMVRSGASTFPGISSAVIAALCDGREPRRISMTMSPANRTRTRGEGTIASVLSYAGRRLREWQNGQWRSVRGWQRLRWHWFPLCAEDETTGQGARRGIWRLVSHVRVADTELLREKYPSVETVEIGAGLGLITMQASFWLLSWFFTGTDWISRRCGEPEEESAARQQRWARALAPHLKHLSEIMFPYDGQGDDNGFMNVSVELEGAGKKTWELQATGGDGPFVAVSPAILLVRRLLKDNVVKVGATHCDECDVSWSEVEALWQEHQLNFEWRMPSAPRVDVSRLKETKASVGTPF